MPGHGSHGHAARNDAHARGAALARAEQTFDRAAAEDDPAWLADFDEAYLAARMAQRFRHLHGRATPPATRAARWTWTAATYAAGPSISPCSPPPTPPKASRVSMAVGRQALDLTVRLTSARSVRYVRDLVRVLRPQADVPAVRDFTAEVRERLPAAAGAAPR